MLDRLLTTLKARFGTAPALAEAVLAARRLIVKGAVGMVEAALTDLGERGVVDLDEDRKAAITAFQDEVKAALTKAGYPAAADPEQINTPVVVAVLTYLVLLVTMVYGPIAALLVELFPTRIRYTAMSLPYHIGNGWFGGFLPTTAFAMVAATGNIYFGLWYPVAICAATVVIGLVFLPETFRRNIDD